MPVARTSRAVASPILFTRSGSLEAQERQDEYIYQHTFIDNFAQSSCQQETSLCYQMYVGFRTLYPSSNILF